MIQAEDLRFAYRRGAPALRGLSFQVKEGETFGVLGPSGAGKSTLMQVLAGRLRRYQGTARLAGRDCDRLNPGLYGRVGFGWETPALYDRLTAMENLRFFESLYDRPCFSCEELLERMGLAQAANMRVSSFSRGMKTRLEFARAILPNPDILLLDEPTEGLDPESARRVKSVLLGMKAQGKTILLSTHRMEDAAELCDRVGFLADGELRAVDTPRNLTAAARKTAVLTYAYQDGGREQKRTVPLNQTAQDTVLQFLIQSNRLVSLHTDEPTLAEVFTQTTGRRADV